MHQGLNAKFQYVACLAEALVAWTTSLHDIAEAKVFVSI